MPLNTRCRHCGRLFPVYAQQIKERKGRVGCPQCGKRFDAIGGLLDEALPAVQTRAMGNGVVSGLPPATSASASADLMDFGEEGAVKGRLQTALWSLGILLLVAGLVLQLGWWDRGKWMPYSRVQAVTEGVCERIGWCPALPRLAGTMEIHRPALNEQEQAAEKMRLTLILINKAAIHQRLPQLQLELYDEKGELVAARRFAPKEYLAGTSTDKGLAPGSAVRPKLDLESLPTPASGFRVKLY